MTNYDGVDLLWSEDGDIAIGRDGDIADTGYDLLLAAKQDVYDRVKCDKGDYSEIPTIGAGLSDFIGETNTRERGDEIQKRIFSCLRTGGTFDLGDFSISTFPLTLNSIISRIEMRVQATPQNKNTRLVNLNMLYAYHENNIYPVKGAD